MPFPAAAPSRRRSPTTAQVTPFPAPRPPLPLPALRSFALTDTGRWRSSNEDAFGADDGRRLYVVADGVGGADHGEIASRMVVEEILSPPERPALGSKTPEIVVALRRAHGRLASAAAADRRLRGMSTTVVALHLDGATSAVLTHLGDSRAYRLRGGELERLTSDHTLAAELRLAGVAPLDDGRVSSWSVNMLTRCLNTEEPPNVDATRVDVRPGDLFLLCSDGLTKMVADDDIRRCLVEGWRSRVSRVLARAARSPLERACRRLVDRALANGGSDNVTVVLVEVPVGGSPHRRR